MQPQRVKWALSKLGVTLNTMIGEPVLSSTVRPRTRQATAERVENVTMKTNTSLPTQRKIPLGFLFNASKGENVVRELTDEFDAVFIEHFGGLMCRVFIYLT